MTSCLKWLARIGFAIAVFAAASLSMWQPAQAQLSSATLRGFVQTAAGQGSAAVQVQPSKVVGPMRTYKFGLRYDF